MPMYTDYTKTMLMVTAVARTNAKVVYWVNATTIGLRISLIVSSTFSH